MPQQNQPALFLGPIAHPRVCYRRAAAEEGFQERPLSLQDPRAPLPETGILCLCKVPASRSGSVSSERLLAVRVAAQSIGACLQRSPGGKATAGCWAVTGPGAVRGPPGGSVAVRCGYRTGYERYHKFWCQEGGGLVEDLVGGWLCSNGHIVETDGSEAEVTRGRVSIRDNHTQRVFTVTLEHLTWADAGTYHCGVVRTGIPDLSAAVEVTVSADHSSPAPTKRSSSATVQPASSSPSKPTFIWTTTEKEKSSFSTTQDTTASVTKDSDILLHILPPCVLLLLILFLLAAVMLVRLSKKRKKALSGASVQSDKKINLSNLAVGNNAAYGSPEYAVIDSPAATDQTGLYSNVEILPNSVNPDGNYVGIQPHCQGSEEVSYATVTISTPDQQSIYANVEQRPKTTRPAKPPEETLYSAVKQTPKH